MNSLCKFILSVVVVLGLLFQQSSAITRVAERRADKRATYNWEEYTGYYKPTSKNIKGFEGLLMITIAPRVPKGYGGNYSELLVSSVDSINVGGRVAADAEEYEFQSATLKKRDSVHLTFITKEMAGIAYRFRGRYVTVKVKERSDYAIEGTLSRYSDGKLVSKAKLTLAHTLILE